MPELDLQWCCFVNSQCSWFNLPTVWGKGSLCTKINCNDEQTQSLSLPNMPTLTVMYLLNIKSLFLGPGDLSLHGFNTLLFLLLSRCSTPKHNILFSGAVEFSFQSDNVTIHVCYKRKHQTHTWSKHCEIKTIHAVFCTENTSFMWYFLLLKIVPSDSFMYNFTFLHLTQTLRKLSKKAGLFQPKR